MYINYKLLTLNYKLLILFRFVNNRIDDWEETNQRNGRCHHNATSTEDISIESVLIRACTTHQEETDDDNRHSNGQQNEVHLVKC